MRLALTVFAAAASLAVLGASPAAQAQGFAVGPGGVTVDPGFDVHRHHHYREGGDFRDGRGYGEFRHHRDYRRDYGYGYGHGYDRHHFHGYDGDRRHFHHDRHDDER